MAGVANRIDCSICMDSNPGPVDTTLDPCGHQYHFQCISQWTRIRNTCPLDRRIVTHFIRGVRREEVRDPSRPDPATILAMDRFESLYQEILNDNLEQVRGILRQGPIFVVIPGSLIILAAAQQKSEILGILIRELPGPFTEDSRIADGRQALLFGHHELARRCLNRRISEDDRGFAVRRAIFLNRFDLAQARFREGSISNEDRKNALLDCCTITFPPDDLLQFVRTLYKSGPISQNLHEQLIDYLSWLNQLNMVDELLAMPIPLSPTVRGKLIVTYSNKKQWDKVKKLLISPFPQEYREKAVLNAAKENRFDIAMNLYQTGPVSEDIRDSLAVWAITFGQIELARSILTRPLSVDDY